MAYEAINFAKKFGLFHEQWQPKVIAEMNDYQFKIVKLEGDFVWHHHENEDEMFLVIKGSFVMRLRDRDLRLEAGEMVIIPRGVEHLPMAEEEVQVLLIEPKTTLNTGNVESDRTVEKLQRI